MSNRTAESNKAIATAWENEQKRVSEGKGTRDWTPEQQNDILTRGKAYDISGKAFEGQHMRSAEMHPECQGDPNNIQFLTRAEHLEAHDGAWTNPTNWYYDPVTKSKHDFGDGPIIPCKVFKLSEPLAVVEAIPELKKDCEPPVNGPEAKMSSGDGPPTQEKTSFERQHANIPSASKVAVRNKSSLLTKIGTGVAKSVRVAGKYIADHKEAFILGGLALLEGYINYKFNSSGSPSGNNADSNGERIFSEDNSFEGDTDSTDGFTYDEGSSSDTNYPETHKSPREHVVPGHGQHYNTKEGRIWKEKGPYPRGGNHSDDD